MVEDCLVQKVEKPAKQDISFMQNESIGDVRNKQKKFAECGASEHPYLRRKLPSGKYICLGHTELVNLKNRDIFWCQYLGEEEQIEYGNFNSGSDEKNSYMSFRVVICRNCPNSR